jgi:hypothetical protein
MKADAVTPHTASANKTAAPIAPGATGAVPEFCRPGDMPRLFGIGRTYAYQLIQEGKIKSVSLRKRGARFGVRLISCDSVREFLAREMEKAEKDAPPYPVDR